MTSEEPTLSELNTIVLRLEAQVAKLQESTELGRQQLDRPKGKHKSGREQASHYDIIKTEIDPNYENPLEVKLATSLASTDSPGTSIDTLYIDLPSARTSIQLENQVITPDTHQVTHNDVITGSQTQLYKPPPLGPVSPQIIDDPDFGARRRESLGINWPKQAHRAARAWISDLSSPHFTGDSMELITALKDELADLRERTTKMENSFGVEKIILKDAGDKVLVTVETSKGSFQTTAPHFTPGGGGGVGGAGGGVGNLGIGGLTTSSSMAQQPMMGKGGPPAGMTPDQLQEFKKQSLQINALQQKLKELESKLSDATLAIKKGNERTGELEEKESDNVKELYKCIDAINNSLSEKITQQKVEVQKIAGDTPKPINYDPFNYGEAYGGDLVDFQARKRITEIKLLLSGLQASMVQMRDSVKVSPNIDLGYKVVRLDQLVAGTTFDHAIEKGEATHEDAVLLSQSASREPGKIPYPRKEIFQTTEEMESKWAITDSIMQTMYRLEMELGELQRVVGASDMASNARTIEELHANIRNLKDKQLDVKTVKKMIEESIHHQQLQQQTMSTTRARAVSLADGSAIVSMSDLIRDYVTKTRFEEATRHLNKSIDSLSHRVAALDQHTDTRPASASTKTRQGSPDNISCLACDRPVAPPKDTKPQIEVALPEADAFSGHAYPRCPAQTRSPPKLRYFLKKAYNVEINNQVVDVYSIPRSCGGTYDTYWPKKWQPDSQDAQNILAISEHQLTDMRCNYIKGTDGHWYQGNKEAITVNMCAKRPPMSIMEARKDTRKHTDIKTPAGENVRTFTNYRGNEFVKTSQIETTEPKKAAIPNFILVTGEGKVSPSNQAGLQSGPPMGSKLEETMRRETPPMEDKNDNARQRFAAQSSLPDSNNNASDTARLGHLHLLHSLEDKLIDLSNIEIFDPMELRATKKYHKDLCIEGMRIIDSRALSSASTDRKKAYISSINKIRAVVYSSQNKRSPPNVCNGEVQDKLTTEETIEVGKGDGDKLPECIQKLTLDLKRQVEKTLSQQKKAQPAKTRLRRPPFYFPDRSILAKLSNDEIQDQNSPSKQFREPPKQKQHQQQQRHLREATVKRQEKPFMIKKPASVLQQHQKQFDRAQFMRQQEQNMKKLLMAKLGCRKILKELGAATLLRLSTPRPEAQDPPEIVDDTDDSEAAVEVPENMRHEIEKHGKLKNIAEWLDTTGSVTDKAVVVDGLDMTLNKLNMTGREEGMNENSPDNRRSSSSQLFTVRCGEVQNICHPQNGDLNFHNRNTNQSLCPSISNAQHGKDSSGTSNERLVQCKASPESGDSLHVYSVKIPPPKQTGRVEFRKQTNCSLGLLSRPDSPAVSSVVDSYDEEPENSSAVCVPAGSAKKFRRQHQQLCVQEEHKERRQRRNLPHYQIHLPSGGHPARPLPERFERRHNMHPYSSRKVFWANFAGTGNITRSVFTSSQPAQSERVRIQSKWNLQPLQAPQGRSPGSIPRQSCKLACHKDTLEHKHRPFSASPLSNGRLFELCRCGGTDSFEVNKHVEDMKGAQLGRGESSWNESYIHKRWQKSLTNFQCIGNSNSKRFLAPSPTPETRHFLPL